MALRSKKDELLIVRKSGRKRHHEHESHGSWKVAYADFVTAMMAFFLLMWLLNATTEDQKKALTEYFNPYESESSSQDVEVSAGIISIMDGGLFGGTQVNERELEDNAGEPEAALIQDSAGSRSDFGVNTWDRVEISREEYDNLRKLAQGSRAPEKTVNLPDPVSEELDLSEKEAQLRIQLLKKVLDEKILSSEEFQEFKDRVSLEIVPEGLKIQLMDQDDFSMFRLGSAVLEPRAEALIEALGGVLRSSGNNIVITGHTDGRPFSSARPYSNWELSSDRANAARRAIVAAGVGKGMIYRVEGRADNDLLHPEDVMDARNRRINFLILK